MFCTFLCLASELASADAANLLLFCCCREYVPYIVQCGALKPFLDLCYCADLQSCDIALTFLERALKTIPIVRDSSGAAIVVRIFVSFLT